MKQNFLILAFLLFWAVNAGANPISPVPILSPSLMLSFDPLFFFIALVLDFFIDLLVFWWLCSTKIAPDFVKKTGKRFFLAVLLVTLAGAAADIIGVFLLIPASWFFAGWAFILYPVSGFILIYCFDYLILTRFLKTEKSKAKMVAVGMGIITNPAILLFIGLFFGPFIENPNSWQVQPIEVASDTLEEAYNTQYMLISSSAKATFNKDYAITGRATIQRADLGLSEDQICLSLGDYSGGSNFGGDTSFIRYNLGGKINVKFSALCVPGEEMLSQLGEYGSSTEIKSEWASNCECVQDPTLAEKTCCLVMLRYAT
jgi:hypothetical protein